MRFQKFMLQSRVLFLLSLLLISEYASFSHGRRILSREVARRRGEDSTASMGVFSNASPLPEPDDDDEFSTIYGVSKRLVPQGPNPLHN